MTRPAAGETVGSMWPDVTGRVFARMGPRRSDSGDRSLGVAHGRGRPRTRGRRCGTRPGPPGLDALLHPRVDMLGRPVPQPRPVPSLTSSSGASDRNSTCHPCAGSRSRPEARVRAMSDATGPVSTSIDEGVAVVRFDDGKANVLSYDAVAALDAALDRAQADAASVCIVGRDGKLSAGFDLAVMTAGPDAARHLVAAGGELLMRLYLHPQPVVVAVTGHALAAGALLVLSCDVRIGADVPAKIGLNETAIGMSLPLFALALAEDRLDRRHLSRATLGAQGYDPHGAVDAGHLAR